MLTDRKKFEETIRKLLNMEAVGNAIVLTMIASMVAFGMLLVGGVIGAFVLGFRLVAGI